MWLSAWYYGRTGGLTTTGAASLAILYFFLRPDPEATTPSWSVLTRLIVFVLMASLLTWLTASWRDGRRLLASTLSSIGDAVLATDRDGRITFLNPVAEALTGWPGAGGPRQTGRRQCCGWWMSKRASLWKTRSSARSANAP